MTGAGGKARGGLKRQPEQDQESSELLHARESIVTLDVVITWWGVSPAGRAEARPTILGSHQKYFQRGTTCSSKANGLAGSFRTDTRTQPTSGEPGTCIRVRFRGRSG